MSATNLRSGLSDLINTLNKVRNNCTDSAAQAELQKLLGILMLLWEEVIRQTLDSSTRQYAEALESLEAAEQQAQKALADIKQIADVISSATKAAKAVDSVVQAVLPILGHG